MIRMLNSNLIFNNKKIVKKLPTLAVLVPLLLYQHIIHILSQVILAVRYDYGVFYLEFVYRFTLDIIKLSFNLKFIHEAIILLQLAKIA